MLCVFMQHVYLHMPRMRVSAVSIGSVCVVTQPAGGGGGGGGRMTEIKTIKERLWAAFQDT